MALGTLPPEPGSDEALIAELHLADSTKTYDDLLSLLSNKYYNRFGNTQAEQLERVLLGFLHTIPVENAKKLIGQLLMGRPPGHLAELLEDLEDTLKQPPVVASPPLAPEMEEPHPHEPAERHYKHKKSRSVHDANRVMMKIINGEEAGG